MLDAFKIKLNSNDGTYCGQHTCIYHNYKLPRRTYRLYIRTLILQTRLLHVKLLLGNLVPNRNNMKKNVLNLIDFRKFDMPE